MATENVLINFEVDYTDLTNAQAELAKTGKIDQKGFDAIQSAINETATDTKGLIKTFKDVAGASIKMGKTVEDAFGAGIQDALDQAGVSLDEFSASLKKANQPATTLKKELAQLKESMVRMKAEGKDTGKEFDSLRQRAGKLSDAIADANAEIKNAGSDTRGIDNVVGSISALAGGYAAVQGAAALFGEESEDLQKALLKVNAAMALATGLQQVYTAVQKEGALAKLADSVATGAQTAATTLLTFVTTGATVAARAYRVALLATGIGAVIVLIAGLVAVMRSLKDETESAADKQERLAKATERLNEAIAQETDDLEFATKAQILHAKIAGKSEKDLTKIRIAGIEDRIAINKKARDQAIRDGLDNEREIQKAIVQDQDELTLLKLQLQADEADKLREARKKLNEKDAALRAKNKAAMEADLKDAEDQKRVADANYIKGAIARAEQEILVEQIKYDNIADMDAQLYETKKKNAADWDALWKEFQESLVKSSEAAAAKIKADADAALAQRIKNVQITVEIGNQLVSIYSQIAQAQTDRDRAVIQSQRERINNELAAGVISQKQAEARFKQVDILSRRAANAAAKREKQAAVFSALLAIPKAFLQGLSQGGIKLAIVYAALAAVEAALIASKPVPRFFRGKKDGYEGPGMVADMGAELVEREGRMYLYTKPTQTYLGANDKVYTASETRNIMHNTNVNTTVRPAAQEKFDYQRLAKAIPVSTQVVNIDKDFISESVANGLSRTNYMDRRYSSRK